MVQQIEGRPQHVADAPRQRCSIARGVNACLNDRKLVATHARRRIGFANACAQPVGNGLQQLVADLMPERVIDTFEVVQIETQHGEALAPSSL
jgi:hypothetical protein